MPFPDYTDPRELQRLVLTWEKGLMEDVEQSRVPVGYAVQLENWRPEPDGGLRARVGWSKGSTTSIPADGGGATYGTRRIRGIGYCPFTSQRYVVGHDNGNNQIALLALPRSNLSGGTWASLGLVTATSNTTKSVDFTFGLGNLWVTNPGFTKVNAYDGASLTSVTASPANATCVEFWRNRIWAGGGSTAYRVYYSAIDSATGSTDWPASNVMDFGRDDGEQIEDLAVFNDMLIVGKQNGVWIVAGDNPDNFQKQPMPYVGGTSPGCAVGKSLLPTPYGLIIVGNENVWLFDGQQAKVISNAIDSTFSIATTSYVSTAYIDRKCYIADNGITNRIYVFNVETQAWAVETLSSTAEFPGALMGHFGNLLMGPSGGTIGSMLNYRAHPSSTRIKDYGVTSDIAETFIAKSPELWPLGALRPSTLRHIELIVRQRVATGAIPLVVTPTLDGVAQSAINVTIPGATGTYRYRLDVGYTGYSHQLQLSHTLAATQGPIFDVEETALLFAPEGFR